LPIFDFRLEIGDWWRWRSLGRRAIFLDRDGTINEEVNYLSKAEDFRLLPEADWAIHLLQQHGWLVILITNQSGVARGFYTVQDVEAIHDRLQGDLAKVGASVDGIYYCPHHPDDNCQCRKPGTMLFQQASHDFGIDFSASYAVGDKLSDLLPGERLGCGTILVLTGHGQREMEAARQQGFSPDHIAADLYQAVKWIINENPVRL
jgi:histidinol-phosphate phosphatase family protein